MRIFRSRSKEVPCLFRQGTFFITLFVLIFSPALAQEHLQLQKEAEKYYQSDDIENALVTAQAALSQAELSVGKDHFEYADILSDLSAYTALTGNFKEAIAQSETALEIMKRRKGTENKDYSEALHVYGFVLYLAGEYNRSEKILTEAVAKYKIHFGPNDKDYAIALNTLALVQMEVLQKYREAEDNFLLARVIIEKNNMTGQEEYTSLLTNLGSVAQSQGRYAEAEKYYKQSARADKKAGRELSPGYTHTLQNLGTLYMDMGRWDEAEAMIRREIELKKQVLGEESPDFAMALNNYAFLCNKTGKFSEAEEYYKKAIALKEKLIGKEHPDYVRAQNNLATLYQEMGRTDEALALMRQAMVQVKKKRVEDPLYYAFYAANFGFLCSAAEKYDEAEKVYQDVMSIYKDQVGEKFGEYTESLSDLAVVYMSKDDYKKARELLLRAAELAKKAGKYDSYECLELMNNLACAYQAEKNLTMAVQVMRDAVRIAKDYYGERHYTFGLLQFNLAIFLDENGQDDEAEKEYAYLIELDFYNLEHNFASLSETEKANFFSTVSRHFDVYYRFAVERAKSDPKIAERVLNFRLATKSMLLNSSRKIRDNILSGKDSTLINSFLDWKAQRDYLVKLYALPKRELALMRVNLDSMERAVNSMEKKLSKSTGFSGSQIDRSFTWKSVQAELKPGEAAIEMIRIHSPFADETDKVFYIALIIDQESKDYPRMVVMDNGYDMERNYVRQYRENIFDTTKKEETYLYFWDKIGQEVSGKKAIWFSGDGVYAKINLNSVRDPVTRSWLIDRHEFHFVSSLRDLPARSKPAVVYEKTASLFGFPDYTLTYVDSSKSPAELQAEQLLARSQGASRSFFLEPLPGTKREVTEIWKLLREKGWKVNTYMAQSALESKIKGLNSPALLHIATHGYFQSDVDATYTPATSRLAEKMSGNPLLRSGLMMAGASNAYNVNYANTTNWTGREDGILTAYEAMNLNLDRTELVVLSACETGLGEIRNGEGVYGLQRAFLAAGARSVIMSLWPVSDAATQKLMTLFYAKWIETGDKYQAFQFAQKELRKTFPDPYYWSAFILVGK